MFHDSVTLPTHSSTTVLVSKFYLGIFSFVFVREGWVCCYTGILENSESVFLYKKCTVLTNSIAVFQKLS